MLNKGYAILAKILIYLSLGLFILFQGEMYFTLSPGFRKILIVMLFLFAFLRILEAIQWYQVRQENDRMKLKR